MDTAFLNGNKIKEIYTEDNHAFLVDNQDKVYAFGNN